MGVMSLGVGQNANVTITAEGDDEKEVIEAIAETMKKEGLATNMSRQLNGIAAGGLPSRRPICWEFLTYPLSSNIPIM